MSKNSYPKRILLAVSYNVETGGVPAVLMTWIENSLKDNIQYEWYFAGNIIDKSLYTDLLNKGVKLYIGNHDVVGMDFYHPIVYVKYLRLIRKDINRLVDARKYDVIHVNGGELVFSAMMAKLASRKGIKSIIHSHSTGAVRTSSYLKRLLLIPVRRGIAKNADIMAACSYNAASSMFGKSNMNKAVVVNNFIDTNRFKFSVEKRKRIRNKLQVNDCFILGQVARLAPEKNQSYLIDIFKQIYKKMSNYRLLLVGEGSIEDDLKLYAKNSGLDGKVIFAGGTDTPEDYYCAMDLFVLPSLFEGMPVSGIEAQATGLPCVFSDSVTCDVKIISECIFISLKATAEQWADKILEFIKDNKDIDRENAWKIIHRAGYDKSNIDHVMMSLYESTINC